VTSTAILVAAAAAVIVLLALAGVAVRRASRRREVRDTPRQDGRPPARAGLVCPFCRREYDPGQTGRRCPSCGAATPRR
jgi:hypothetical protein